MSKISILFRKIKIQREISNVTEIFQNHYTRCWFFLILGRKPWPQKRTGRSHAGSIRTHQFIRGGFSKGVRGPTNFFYILPNQKRIMGEFSLVICNIFFLNLSRNEN